MMSKGYLCPTRKLPDWLRWRDLVKNPTTVVDALNASGCVYEAIRQAKTLKNNIDQAADELKQALQLANAI